jgi:hypothetical protein
MVPARSTGYGCCSWKVSGGCSPGEVVEGPLKVTASPEGTTVKTAGCEVDSEAESVTVTLPVSTVVSRAAGTTAVNWVALTNVVASGVALKFTTEVEVKFVPVAVTLVLLAPAVAPVGAIVFSTTAGTGDSTTTEIAEDVETAKFAAPE